MLLEASWYGPGYLGSCCYQQTVSHGDMGPSSDGELLSYGLLAETCPSYPRYRLVTIRC